MRYITQGEEETKNVGKKIAEQLKSGDVVLLHGNLGAGKTTLVKGIGQAFGIEDTLVSPTFILMNIYEIKPIHRDVRYLVHIDTYRLKTEQELIDIGANEYIGAAETVTCVEWGEKLSTLLKNKKVIKIHLSKISEEKRQIEVE